MTYDNNGSPNEGVSNTNLKLIALMNRIYIIEANEFVCETRLNRYSSIDVDYIALTFTNFVTQGLTRWK